MELQFSEPKVLMDLGLTLVQARLYLALVESGTSKISAISKSSKVARPDVYNNLSKLQKLGLVEETIQSPKASRAIPMNEALSLLLEREKNQFKKVRAETLLLIDKTQQKMVDNKLNNGKGTEQHQFVIVPRGAAIRRIRNAIERAQLSINFILSWKKFTRSMVNVFAESMETAWMKNVKNRFIIECPLENETVKKMMCFYSGKPFCKIRYTSTCPETNLVMCDKSEVFMLMDPHEDLRMASTLWSNNPSFIALVAEYFKNTWLTASENIPKTSPT